MNKEHLIAGGIRYYEALERFCGNEAMYEKYLRKLLTLPLYDDMKTAFATGDDKTAFEACHKLKSFVGNLSITALYESVCVLTELLRHPPIDRQKAAEQIEKTDVLYQNAIALLKTELK